MIRIFALSLIAAKSLASAEIAPDTLEIAVNFENAEVGSKVHACLWTADKGFPICDQSAAYHALIDAEHGAAAHVFRDLAPGVYAVGGFNDLDGDGKLDRNLLGFPTEPIAIFLDGERPRRRPAFKDAALRFEGSASLDLELRRPGRP